MALQGISMTERADEIANNAWLKLIGRIAMAVVGAMMIPVTLGVWGWAEETSEDLETLRNRVAVLEAQGRQDVRFQEETSNKLQQILGLVSQGNERTAKVEAQIDALQRQIDRTVR